MRGVRLGMLALLAACGCGGGNRPVPVQGIVLLDGKPLAGATITFVPDSPGAREAHAFSTADGTFKLSTYRPDDGALPGEYKVVVTYTEPVVEMPAGATQEEVMKALERADRTKKRPPVVLPESYTNAAKTKLRQKVPPEGAVRLELSRKGQ